MPAFEKQAFEIQDAASGRDLGAFFPDELC
jgi:hypothetical protein